MKTYQCNLTHPEILKILNLVTKETIYLVSLEPPRDISHLEIIFDKLVNAMATAHKL